MNEKLTFSTKNQKERFEEENKNKNKFSEKIKSMSEKICNSKLISNSKEFFFLISKRRLNLLN